ncbi:MAG: FecR domain-containing protein, partial [Balneolaceae bacterium]|nr:FecR domain-containing protein [Balneolaceae bacterium]
ILSFSVGLGAYWYSSEGFVAGQPEELANKRTLITGPYEQKMIRFTNGSKIVLRRNSSMKYGVDRLHKGIIEVISLKGEAYFESGARSAATSFLVHTPDGIIHDIGTKFLVNVEDQHSKVLLQQGRVQVQSLEKANNKYSFEPKVGEVVTFNRSDILSRELVNTTFYTAWATGYLEFDKTSVDEFAQFVEERFDVTVKVVDPQLSDITLDGAIYFNSLEELVRSISEVAKFPVSQSADNQTVYLGK